ncbi:hypothetical protein V7S43_008668 [Phytophthora oleae]|uniref:Crinkler effector protein N-terminal domain-containing protein n=1 Tax=Phytophthora oleae TaxID=2107226 RepID=A0ABD3FJ57_9STRA
MVNLFCAIVGVPGSVFDVDIDERKPVSHLKKVIKDLNEGLIAAPWKLKLFLAKKNEGKAPWLTEAEVENGEIDTTGLKRLNSAKAAIGAAGLSSDAVKLQLTKQKAEGLNLQMKGPIHVVVMVPEQRQQLQAEDVQREKIRQELIRLSRERAEFECELQHKTPKSNTTGTLGEKEQRRLDSNQLIFDTAPVENGEAFGRRKFRLKLMPVRRRPTLTHLLLLI